MNRPLPIALLLIASGGFMDAHTYLAYEHVFTNAQSGNVVLLAVHLAEGHWTEALKHIPALLAFFPGIFAGQAIMARRTIAGLRSDAVVLAAELTTLLVIGSVGSSLSTALVTFSISLISAMQNTAFKTVGGIAYTSVVTTGNLRSMSEDLFVGWSRGDAKALAKARILGAICAAFAIGALAGAALTLVWGKTAIYLPVMFITFALAARLLEERKTQTQGVSRDR